MQMSPGIAAAVAMLDQLDPSADDLNGLAYALGRLTQMRGHQLPELRAALVDGFDWQDTEFVAVAAGREVAAIAGVNRTLRHRTDYPASPEDAGRDWLDDDRPAA